MRSLVIAVALALVLPAAVGAVNLFSEAASPGARVSSPDTTLSRVASVNPEALALMAEAPPEHLSLNLFPGLTIGAARTAVIPATIGAGVTWVGQVGGTAESRAVIHTVEGALAGRVQLADGQAFDIAPRGVGSVLIREIDLASQVDQCGGPVVPVISRTTLLTTPETASDAGVIDVMVCHTPAARLGAGGTAGIEAQIALAIDLTNLAFEDSGVFPRVRLVHIAEVDYTESGDMNTDIARLRIKNDGYMDEVHTLRNTFGADQVSLVVEGGNFAGIAYLLTMQPSLFSEFAFSVVARSSATSYLTFTHELGHNLGCAHDHDNGTVGYRVYSFGHRFTGQSGQLWRTVMSYAPGIRIGRFSNPDLLYDETPTGVAGEGADAANNALSLNEVGPGAALWRPTAVVIPPAITLDRSLYSTVVSAEVRVQDAASSGLTSLAVSVETDQGDAESLVLPQTAAGVFSGQIALGAGGPVPGDGALQIVSGALITASVTTVSGFASDTATVDTEPPEFAGIVSAETMNGGVLLSWNPGTDDAGEVTYLIHASEIPEAHDWQSPLATTQSLSHTSFSIPTGETRWLAVRARDEAGNLDGNTAEIAVTIAGSIERFEWSPIASPQIVGVPVSVTIAARDSAGTLVTAFHEAATLTAVIGTEEFGVGFSPTFTGAFQGGMWSGEIDLHVEALGVRMRARSYSGTVGESDLFDALEPRLSIADGEASEGDDGLSVAQFEVTLSAPVSATVSCDSQSDTARRDIDYMPVSRSLSFGPGTLSQPVTVEIIGDLIHEGDETFQLVLFNPQGAVIGQGTADCVILDDDAPEDATLAKLLGLRSLSDEEEEAADVNGDGEVDAADVVSAISD